MAISGSTALKELFGRALRVHLAKWVHEQDKQAFLLQDACLAMELLGEARSGVAKELRLFVKHGLLVEMREPNRAYFLEIESAYWDAFREICVASGLTWSAVRKGTG